MTLRLGVALVEAFAHEDTDAILAALDSWAALVGSYPALFALWVTMGSETTRPSGAGRFPEDALMDGLRDRGCCPMIYLEPTGDGWHAGGWANAGWDHTVASYRNWTNGTLDPWMVAFFSNWRRWAFNENSLGLTTQGDPKSSTIIVSFAKEMNGNGYMPYRSTDPNAGKAGETTGNRPAQFPAVFTRLRQLRDRCGAGNVKLHWCPWPVDGTNFDALTNLLPADADVDYLGADLYCASNVDNNGPWSDVPSLRARFNSNFDHNHNNDLYDQLTALSTKPLLLAESGVEGYTGQPHTDAERTSWITGTGWGGTGAAGGYPYVAASLPRVDGIVYFHASGNWRFADDSGGNYSAGHYPLMAAEMGAQYAAHPERMPSTTQADLRIGRSGIVTF